MDQQKMVDQVEKCGVAVLGLAVRVPIGKSRQHSGIIFLINKL